MPEDRDRESRLLVSVSKGKYECTLVCSCGWGRPPLSVLPPPAEFGPPRCWAEMGGLALEPNRLRIGVLFTVPIASPFPPVWVGEVSATACVWGG